MRSIAVVGSVAALLLGLTAPGLAQDAAPQGSAAQDCAPAGGMEFVCGQGRAEDLYHIPGTDWVLSSWLDGGIAAVDINTRRTVMLYPTQGAAEQLDRTRFAGCPGPADAEQKARFIGVGIGLRPGADGVHTLYLAHFGWKRGVDVFDLDVRGEAPRATWIGCVIAPDEVGVDGIVPIEDEGFIITNWVRPGPNVRAEIDVMRQGQVNGQLWQWKPAEGWSILPGSESSGPNGIEISPDGRHVYFAAWGGKRIVRLSRGEPVTSVDFVTVDFRPDNLRWSPEGKLLVAGQVDNDGGTRLIEVDPDTLAVTPLLALDDTELFAMGTGAIRVGDSYWIGSARSDRIAIVPAGR